MSINKNILVVNYDFPPNQGIGGRRWAKLVKQLAKEGFIVHVIKANPVSDNTPSPWTSDTINENIIVHSLQRKYPENFSNPKGTFTSRILYRIQKNRLEKREKGTIYDISIGWDEVLIPKAKELIQSFGIVTVIASGAPWKMLSDVADLKFSFPGLNLIIDYRDPWLNAQNYGMPGLSIARRKEEERKQTYILENTAAVITPYEYLNEELNRWVIQHCKNRPMFKVITHFFDPEDIYKPEIKTTEKITLVYGGDLYFGIEKVLLVLRNQLLEVKEKHNELYQKLEIRFFTNKHNDRTFDGLDVVKMNPSIGKKIFEEISHSSACLILLPSNKRNDRTTKFYEYLPYKKPFLIISEEGEVTDFVRKNRLGYILDSKENSLLEILQKIESGDSNINKDFDYNEYSLARVTSQLRELIK